MRIGVARRLSGFFPETVLGKRCKHSLGAPNAIFVQTNNRFRYLNPAACQLLGEENPGKLLGQSVLDRVHPTYHDVVLRNIQILHVDKKEVAEHEVLWVRLDGTEVLVEVSSVPTTYEGHDGSLAFAHDITARKKTEGQLRESRKTYQDLIENLNDVVFMLSLDGTIEFIRPVVQEIIGHVAHIEQSSEAVSISGIDGTIKYVNKAFETVTGDSQGQAVGSSAAMLMSDQQDRAFYQRDSDGRITGFVGVARDVTELVEIA